MRVLFDLAGQRFGLLTAVRISSSGKGGIAWECRCDCGGRRVATTRDLKRGRVTHCGCSNGVFKHGLSKSPEFTAWRNMIRRCEKQQAKDYANYGGRGIAICERWRLSFVAFFADMGPRPSSQHSLDRINNDGNYEPGNVRWATMREQLRNNSRNRILEFNGIRDCVAGWSERTGLSQNLIHGRLRKRWPVERVLGQSVQR